MYYLYLSIICSVSVAALFKMIKGKSISIFPIIQFNYILAIFYCYYFFDSRIYSFNFYMPNLHIYIVLGVLLPLLFILLNKSIQQVGIIKTDIAQRFSLIIPIVFAILFWNQQFSFGKILGVLLAFIAIFCILFKKDEKGIAKNYVSPVLVLVGYGIVDVLFKKVALISSIPYTSSLLFIFVIAFLIATIYAFIKRKKRIYNLDTIKWGLLLGSLNFINIYTYIKAHQELKSNPTIVFITMNLGVILLSTFVGYFIFKEKINKINTIGIFFALLSILLINLFN